MAARLRALTMAGGGAVALLRATRPRQWSKNALVVAAPLAGGVIDEGEVLARTAGAFLAFCLAAGGTYLLNDARDVDADRRHPRKRHRPVAAGEVGVGTAYATGTTLIVVAVAVGFLITTALGATVLAYLALTTAYSFLLKHVAVVDLVAVASGFVLRAVAGAAASDIPITEWFFIVTSAAALLMIAGKREAELRDRADSGQPGAAPTDGGRVDSPTAAAPMVDGPAGTEATTREVLSAYTGSFLLLVRSVAAGLALIAYCLWAFEVADAPSTNLWFLASIAPFTVAVLRYTLLIDQGKGEEPERLVLEDRILLGAGALWGIIYAYGVYLA